MIESLPAVFQEKIVDQVRELIADLEDEESWQSSFDQTREQLLAFAQRAKQEIAEGKSFPMDYEQLWSLQPYPISRQSIGSLANLSERLLEKAISSGKRTHFPLRSGLSA